jgi:hypothetical protein
MKSRKTFSNRLKLSAAAILILTIVAIWNTKPATAFSTPQKGSDGKTINNVQAANVPINFIVASITQGQTARINVLNTSDINSLFPPGPCRVELSFQYTNGRPVVNRDGIPYDRIFILNPEHGAFLDVNGNDIIPLAGLRLSFTPIVKILNISDGTLVIPTFEMYSNDSKKTQLLNPGLLHGFNPQPEPPGDDQLLNYGMVGITPGQTAQISLLNAPDPDNIFPPGPCVVEMTYHDINGNQILDSSGSPVDKIVTLDPGRGEILLWNFSSGTPGSRVPIVPSIKVLRGTLGTRLVRSFQIYDNDTRRTTVLSSWSR